MDSKEILRQYMMGAIQSENAISELNKLLPITASKSELHESAKARYAIGFIKRYRQYLAGVASAMDICLNIRDLALIFGRIKVNDRLYQIIKEKGADLGFRVEADNQIDPGSDHIHEQQLLCGFIGADFRHIEARHVPQLLFGLIQGASDDMLIAVTSLHPVIELIEIQIHAHVGGIRCQSYGCIGFSLQLFHLIDVHPCSGRGILQCCADVLFSPLREFLEIHHCVSSL